ncbi:MAG TPA: protein translocase subunit SecD [Gemmatimonadales bacterium]|jgi:preprotein translocase subunit SecD|nr:protein translocase subunit SecD [Gemmatimonadales bacterium]
MFASIRNRLIVIAALVLVCVYLLVPRTMTLHERDQVTGAVHDTTVRRVPIKYGLDLQGGMHLALELDQSKQVSSNVKRDIDLALVVLRKRIEGIGTQEPVIQKSGDERIVVELAGITDAARARAVVQQSAFLEFRITDETGALDRALPAMDRALRQLGVKGADTGSKPSAVQQLLGGDSSSKAADSTAPAVLTSLIKPTGRMPGEYLVPEPAFARVDSLLRIPAIQALMPRGVQTFWSASSTSLGVEPVRYLYVVGDRPIITGDRLVDATAQLDPLTNSPVVNFELNSAGGRKFGEETARHIGDFMAIILDGRVQGPPPTIEDRIGRNGRITLAGKTVEEARDLAMTLKAGSLPIPLKIVEQGQVGASLGKDSIHKGILAGIVGTALVVLIMIGYYRMSGVLAVAALALYLLFTLGGLAAVDATLTLPGLAGIVLSIGIAVDANVLIFERIREELLHGKSVRLAVDEGFRHAMNAIVDSNVSTVLTALFLFQFGTGPVQGFAVTLILGIAASMITAVFVTRTFFMIWLDRKPAMSTLSI